MSATDHHGNTYIKIEMVHKDPLNEIMYKMVCPATAAVQYFSSDENIFTTIY